MHINASGLSNLCCMPASANVIFTLKVVFKGHLEPTNCYNRALWLGGMINWDFPYTCPLIAIYILVMTNAYL